jgi:SAM-dependent methyltransferase
MSSSWEKEHDWYDRIVGSKGHYYHDHVILPGVLKLLKLSSTSSLLDLGCGQGILARALPKEIVYTGIDLSPSLIRAAKKYAAHKLQRFLIGDVTRPLPLKEKFTHAALILALQNIAEPLAVFTEAAKHLHQGGKLIIVLNHPCYRIPRQTHWQVDREKKIQYRRVDRYLSPLKIPIQMHPGEHARDKDFSETFSYHFPLSQYSQWLHRAGFVIELIEEWCSDKKSIGKAAAMENRSRKEFPLFIALACRYYSVGEC